jgi:hypothetical protein
MRLRRLARAGTRIRTRVALTVVPTRFARREWLGLAGSKRFLLAGFEGFSLARFKRFRFAAFRAERGPLVAPIIRGRGTGRFPAGGGAFRLGRGEDFQLGLFRGCGAGSGSVFHRPAGGEGEKLSRLGGGRGCGCWCWCGRRRGSSGRFCDGRARLERGRGFAGGGLRSRLVDDWRAHGRFARERILVLALRPDHLEGAGRVATGSGGADRGSPGGAGTFATR